MFNWYRSNTFGEPSRVNSLFPSNSGFGDSSYRYNSNRPSNRYRPRYNRPGWYRPFYDSWWWWGNHGYDNESEEEPEEPEVEEPEEPEVPEKPEEEVPLEPLAVDVDMLAEKNKEAHHTDDFGDGLFAVRRGQEFTIKVTVNRKYNRKTDHLALTFSVGEKPQGSKNTLERVNVEHDKLTEDKPYKWYAVETSIESRGSGSTEVMVDVKPAADCVVGNYKLDVVYYRKEGGKQKKEHRLVESVFILFNAWCKDDQVYMEDDDGRKEYVLRQTGRIYTGNSYWPSYKSWNFGQFSRVAIRAAVYLLQKSKADTKLHGNATHVARALSAVVNSNDDSGVLSGNWSGNYEGGTSPTAWSGSVKILEKYMETKTGVKYGQCWVFSGLVTTLGRSLGIPTRSVTNFDSAHDTDQSLTIDKHLDYNGDELKYLDDSVWNFHVWNEGWFKRSDLPDGYDGWQAFDATPQEASDNLMQCGPAPVQAIKEGNVYLGFDAGFIYAEVNGTRMTWKVRGMKFDLIKVDKDNPVGAKISTKAVGSNSRNDVTDEYKYKEGSPEQEQAKMRAYKYSNHSQKREEILENLDKKFVDDVHFVCTPNQADNGDISLNIKATNTASSRREFPLTVASYASQYTGVLSEELSREKVPISLEPNEVVEKDWFLKAVDYLDVIDEDAMIKINVGARVKPTGQIFTYSKSFPLRKPDLDMQVSNDKPKVGEAISVTMSFTNPVELQLTNAKLTMEGPGILKEHVIELDPVEKGAKFSKTVTVTPKFKGKRELVAVFNSRQLVDISGDVEIDVQPA